VENEKKACFGGVIGSSSLKHIYRRLLPRAPHPGP